LLGQSLENTFGAWLCHGPPLEEGFFYDSFLGNYKVSQADYDKIEKEIKRYAQEKQPYERILLTKQEALDMFKYNPFKTQLIQSKIPENGYTSAYRCGNLIDLCTGPHLPSADRIKGFKVLKNSAAYWLGNKNNDDLQRVYAISFPKQSELDEYVKIQEELAKRDHRNIGPQQNLFNFTDLSPGCALFEPHGTVIYNRLVELMRGEYKLRGYNEVISPNIYNSELWMKSGHYFKYKDNIFFIDDDGEEHGLKPMNCPGHCLMFDLHQRSYRDLPIRMADFGVLHRNELKGALSGLTRVRRFQQDDAHIFCMPEQIEDEILGVLDFIDYIYSVFGFKYNIELSTRPEKYLGKLEDWNLAEAQLKAALAKFGKEYKINEGDGAFYGPKIDFKLFDTFGRQHQCGTCQLDFQLPIRFNLQFRSKDVEKEKPE
jgi:threonyl-tRNA synthetase